MNIYSHRDSNVRKTIFLFVLFLTIVIGIGWVFAQAYGNSLFLYVAVAFAVILSFVSYWHSDKIVLRMIKAHPVSRESNRELYNIVENLVITAGLPMPRIFIIDDPAPNALATGRSPKKAVVAMTRGLLNILDKNELEGVVAHELAHIGNRDMLIGTVAVVLVGFVTIISDMFLRSMFFRSVLGGRGRRGGSGGGGSMLFIFLALILAILAPIGAMLIKFAISRKREFVADATGVLLTRYPKGLSDALSKISKNPLEISKIQNATSHLWIDDPFKGKHKTSWFHKLFLTHPPVEDRIRALSEK